MEIVHRLGCCFVPARLYCESPDLVPAEPHKGNTMNVVFVFGRLVHLSPSEYPILFLLMSHPEGFWVTRNMLLDSIGDTGNLDERSIDTIVKRLRQKLFPHNRYLASSFIETKYGCGYRTQSR